MTTFVPIVSRVTQTALPNPQGRITTAYAVQFNVGPHGPFTLQIDQAEFTADKVKARLDDFAAMLNALPQDAPAAPAAPWLRFGVGSAISSMA
jgi:hypothetical protein